MQHAQPSCDAPLLDTFARLQEVNAYLQVRVGELQAHGGCAINTIIDPAHGALDRHLAIMAHTYKTEDRAILTRFYFSSYAYFLASAVVGPFALEQRVPVLDLATLGVRIGEWGSPERVILARPSFYCLPEDPAASHDDARPVADISHLRRNLREGLVHACEPLIAAVRRRAKIGARSLWIAAAETSAGALIAALPPETTVAVAQREVAALIGDAASVLRAKPEIMRTFVDGACGLALIGSDCCFNFKLDGEDYCETCPHRPRAERLKALGALNAADNDDRASA